ncbi:MAG: HPr family phosphocarrier protein [Deltaproteobacteria bacterium]|nr:HPr family phosphocarrier protein [Deltaproteobacteria bacterium]MBF0508676.1 HPr family phosphocarrier protein [Deltaproteobacteria bacterium]MBF0523983.1 HPr family phosphocarrier protein [Deltaproteobacteria bacterium]
MADNPEQLEINKRLEVMNKVGLHARAAAKIALKSKEFKSQIIISKDGVSADGRSILDILTLNCPKGTYLEIRAKGEDAREVIEALTQLFHDKFEEE